MTKAENCLSELSQCDYPGCPIFSDNKTFQKVGQRLGEDRGHERGYYGRLELVDGTLINTMANLGELSWWALRES